MYQPNTSAVAKLHHDDLLREAEHWRLIKRASGNQASPNIFKTLRAAIANRTSQIGTQAQLRPTQVDFDSGVFSAQ